MYKNQPGVEEEVAVGCVVLLVGWVTRDQHNGGLRGSGECADQGGDSAGRVEEGENAKDSEELTVPIVTAYVDSLWRR